MVALKDPVFWFGVVLLGLGFAWQVEASSRSHKASMTAEWDWSVGESAEGEKILAVSFDDGRKYLFTARHMSGVRFFPAGHAATIEDNAELYITCGATTTRLDVIDEQGQSLVESLVNGTLPKSIFRGNE